MDERGVSGSRNLGITTAPCCVNLIKFVPPPGITSETGILSVFMSDELTFTRILHFIWQLWPAGGHTSWASTFCPHQLLHLDRLK